MKFIALLKIFVINLSRHSVYKNIFGAVLLTCFTPDYSQELSWTTIRIEELGSVGLPSNMEIQGGAYKEISDKVKEINGINASRVIFQQKNLNSFDRGSMQTYSRVFIRTEIGASGDFKKLSESLTQTEADEVNSIFKSQIESKAPKVNARIIEWHKAVTTTLNGQNAIEYGYIRQIGTNKPVLVEVFLLQNNDRLHIITFEYRLDGNHWGTTFVNIKATVKINPNYL